MQKECSDTTIEQKIEVMKEFSVGELLYLLREIENCPQKYDEKIIKICAEMLFNKNIICLQGGRTMASRPKKKKAWRENYKPGYKKLKKKLGSIHDKLPKKQEETE